MRLPKGVLLFVAFGVAVMLAALAGIESGPGDELFDPRRSTFLTGPDGATGFAEVLERLGVPVERRQRALFGLAADSIEIDTTAWLALLDVPFRPSDVEARELDRYVGRGGKIFLAAAGSEVLDGRVMVASNGIERCFGFRATRIDHYVDTLRIRRGPDLLTVAGPRVILRRGGTPARERAGELLPRITCEVIESRRADVLLRSGAQVVATRLTFDGGGRVILLADSRYLSNRDLKETDAGLVVLPWILEERPSRVIVDEYHQGFGHRGSLFRAAWGWVRAAPGGWALLQLVVASLLGLGLAAIRFGPALSVIERRRRSPMEHVEALAVGLERAGGRETAVELVASGLRRRLSRAGHGLRMVQGDIGQWVGSLALAARTPEARRSVARLGSLLRVRGGTGRVLDAAIAVEDVWEALRPGKRQKRS